MKRITTLFFALLLILGISNSLYCQTYVDQDAINENFDAGTLGTWGFSATGGGTVFTNPVGNLNVVFQSPTGTATKTLSPVLQPGDDSKIYVEFDWNVGTPGRTNNTAVLFFRDGSGRKIFGMLGYRLTGNSLRLLNLNTAYANYDDVALKFGTFALGANIHISAVLNFSTHKIETITAYLVGSLPSTGVTSTNLDFLNTAADNLTDLFIDWARGGSGNHTYLFDNFRIYTKKLSAGKANVTINYLDTNGDSIKVDRIAADQDVALVYSATANDKVSFKTATNYYVYNATATAAGVTAGTGDTVLVKSTGSVINLRFSKFDKVDGTYTWIGAASSNWNETENNFTTNGVNSLGAQNENPVIFDSNSSVKSVVLTNGLNLGASNVEVTADGYSFSGSGNLSGIGTLKINPGVSGTTSVNFINSLTGGINILSGTANILNDASANTYIAADGTTLKVNTGVTFSKPVTSTGTLNIDATSNVAYLMPVTAPITNILLQNTGSGTGITWTDYFGGTFTANSQVNVSTSLSSAGFGVTDAVLNNVKVKINDGVRLFRYSNQGASGGGTSTIVIGELSGTAGSTLEGGWVDASNRILVYEIGNLNTSATFNGVIKNYGTVTAAPLNIYKKGTGTWTLTGASTYSPGLFNVDAGTVEMNGSLSGAAVPVTVASGATLKGTGSIAGATTVNGTLEGKLSFGSSLTLAGTATTNLAVTGFNTGEYDVINVTGAVTNGGTLNITVNGSAPEIGTAIKLINAGSYTGTFTTVNVPANYAYDASNGMLYYSTYTGLVNGKADALQVYPTMSRGTVNIEGFDASQASFFTVTGQLVKEVSNLSSKNVLNITDLSNGAYLVKVRFTDGSEKTQNILLKK